MTTLNLNLALVRPQSTGWSNPNTADANHFFLAGEEESLCEKWFSRDYGNRVQKTSNPRQNCSVCEELRPK